MKLHPRILPTNFLTTPNVACPELAEKNPRNVRRRYCPESAIGNDPNLILPNQK